MGPMRPVLVFVLAGCAAQAAERPRGVSPDDARYDVEGQSFSCLAGAFVSIPAAYVNDDYCDCPDGSDEPGTSACAGVGRTRFFCANIGSEARWLSPVRVQDGVCDCCDGSDEVGTAEPCPDACEAEGRARREALQQRLVDAVEGTRAREEALESAKATFAALSRDAAAAEERVMAAREKKSAAREEVRWAEGCESELQRAVWRQRLPWAAEEAEAERWIGAQRVPLAPLCGGADTAGGGEGRGSGSGDAAEADTPLSEPCPAGDEWTGPRRALEALGLALAPAHGAVWLLQWPLRGMRLAGELVAAVLGLREPAAAVRACEAVDRASRSAREWWALTGGLWAWRVAWHATPLWWRWATGGGEPSPLWAPANEARSQLQRATSELSSLEEDARRLREKADADWGPDRLLLTLDGACAETAAGGYRYKACPFDRAWQDAVSLGSWAGWACDQHDSAPHRVLRYTGGDGCWGGPQRSLNVTLVCGPETVLRRVEEPWRCAYTAEMASPVACDEQAEAEAEQAVREALRGMPEAGDQVAALRREGMARWEERVRQRAARAEVEAAAEEEEEEEEEAGQDGGDQEGGERVGGRTGAGGKHAVDEQDGVKGVVGQEPGERDSDGDAAVAGGE